MTGRLKFLFLYYISWIVFFELARLVFLLYNFSEARQLNASTRALTFWYGLRMDASMAGYLLLPVAAFVLASIYLPFFRKPFIYRSYTGVILFFILILIVSDLEVYKSWGFRIDTTPLKYLRSPGEVWASISHLPIFLFIIIFLFVFLAFFSLWRFQINRTIRFLALHVRKIPATVLLVLFMLILIIPIRGGLQQTPMNQSIVYFSKENFANISAINATWNFMYGITKNRDTKNPYEFPGQNRSAIVMDSLYHGSDSTVPVLKTQNPNVIILIWESFTEKAIHASVSGIPVTPGFNRLKNEGLYFSKIYASGDRTDKGLSAILSGYPALNKFSVIHQPAKSGKLPGLSHFFRQMNYTTSFYYGGEPEFANIKSYVYQSGFEKLTGKKDFPSGELNSKWGAHDGSVAARISGDLSNMKSPFFVTWLTLTSHEPYEIPVDPVFPGKDMSSRFLSSIHYTDQVISDFVKQCQQQPWWENTLLIILADHGHPLPEPASKLTNFNIPMLWVGGALKIRGVIDKVGSQVDLAATLASQVRKPPGYFPFSKNLLDPGIKQWAYFSFNNGFGFVQPDKTFLYDNVGKRMITRIGKINDEDVETGMAIQYQYYQDYLNR